MPFLGSLERPRKALDVILGAAGQGLGQGFSSGMEGAREQSVLDRFMQNTPDDPYEAALQAASLPISQEKRQLLQQGLLAKGKDIASRGKERLARSKQARSVLNDFLKSDALADIGPQERLQLGTLMAGYMDQGLDEQEALQQAYSDYQTQQQGLGELETPGAVKQFFGAKRSDPSQFVRQALNSRATPDQIATALQQKGFNENEIEQAFRRASQAPQERSQEPLSPDQMAAEPPLMQEINQRLPAEEQADMVVPEGRKNPKIQNPYLWPLQVGRGAAKSLSFGLSEKLPEYLPRNETAETIGEIAGSIPAYMKATQWIGKLLGPLGKLGKFGKVSSNVISAGGSVAAIKSLNKAIGEGEAPSPKEIGHGFIEGALIDTLFRGGHKIAMKLGAIPIKGAQAAKKFADNIETVSKETGKGRWQTLKDALKGEGSINTKNFSDVFNTLDKKASRIKGRQPNPPLQIDFRTPTPGSVITPPQRPGQSVNPQRALVPVPQQRQPASPRQQIPQSPPSGPPIQQGFQPGRVPQERALARRSNIIHVKSGVIPAQNKMPYRKNRMGYNQNSSEAVTRTEREATPIKQMNFDFEERPSVRGGKKKKK